MSCEGLMQLYSVPGTPDRGQRRKPLRKAKEEAGLMEKPEVVKTHLRDLIMVPEVARPSTRWKPNQR